MTLRRTPTANDPVLFEPHHPSFKDSKPLSNPPPTHSWTFCRKSMSDQTSDESRSFIVPGIEMTDREMG